MALNCSSYKGSRVCISLTWFPQQSSLEEMDSFSWPQSIGTWGSIWFGNQQQPAGNASNVRAHGEQNKAFELEDGHGEL